MNGVVLPTVMRRCRGDPSSSCDWSIVWVMVWKVWLRVSPMLQERIAGFYTNHKPTEATGTFLPIQRLSAVEEAQFGLDLLINHVIEQL